MDATFDDLSVESRCAPVSDGVLIVDLARSFGGAEVRVLQLARALAGRRRYAVAVTANSALAKRLRREGLERRELDYGRWDPRIVFPLARLMRDGRYTVVDAHNNQSQLWAAFAAWLTSTVRLVATVHSIYHVAENRRSLRRGYETALRLMNHHRAQYIAISQEARHWLAAMNIADERIRVITNGIPTSTFSEQDRADARRDLGLDANHVAVFVMARLVAGKGHSFLTQAVARIKDSHPNVRCFYVGDGPEHAKLEREIDRLEVGGMVRCLGFRDDVQSLLAASDVVCLPSLTEGLPFAVLEAAAMGRPVLVTPVGGLADYFVHNENARVVPPADVDALARELVWCSDHPADMNRLGRAAQNLVRRQFNPSQMIEETLAVYDNAR